MTDGELDKQLSRHKDKKWINILIYQIKGTSIVTPKTKLCETCIKTDIDYQREEMD